MTNQRRLRPTSQARPDAYSIEISPPKSVLPLKRQLDEVPQFSPLKRQKQSRKGLPKRGNEVQKALGRLGTGDKTSESGQTPVPATNLRRSTRFQLEPADGVETSPEGVRRAGSDEISLSEKPIEISGSEAATEGEGNLVADDEDTHVLHSNGTIDSTTANDPPSLKRKRGRPPKSSTGKLKGLSRRLSQSSRAEDAPRASAADHNDDLFTFPDNDVAIYRRTPQMARNENMGSITTEDEIMRRKQATDPPKLNSPNARSSNTLGKSHGPARLTSLRPSELYARDDKDGSERTSVIARRGNLGAASSPQARPGARPRHGDRNDTRPGTQALSRLEAADIESTRRTEKSDLSREHLFGQGLALRTVCSTVNKHGWLIREGERERIALKDSNVKTLAKLCTQAEVEVNSLDQYPESDTIDDCPSQFPEMNEMIATLCAKNASSLPDLRNTKKAAQIYFYGIPKLVKLLELLVHAFEVMDTHQATPERTITIPHLRVVVVLIRMILALGEGAARYDRPDTKLAVIQPAKNGILVPLRKVCEEFHDVLKKYGRAQEVVIKAARQREEEVLRRAQEQGEEHRKRQMQALRKKWETLHWERNAAEPGIKPAWKQKHLYFARPRPEIDHNGVEFERVQLFTVRIGPPRLQVEEAERREWTAEEVQALTTGLETQAGPRVYERTFRLYCSKGGLLNKFNVTEIVTKAAELKECWEQNGEEADWIRSIPVWTRPHLLSGKENNAEDRDAVEHAV